MNFYDALHLIMETSHHENMILSEDVASIFSHQKFSTIDPLNINSAVLYLSKFYNGWLKCGKCNERIPFTSDRMTLHQLRCNYKPSKSSTSHQLKCSYEQEQPSTSYQLSCNEAKQPSTSFATKEVNTITEKFKLFYQNKSDDGSFVDLKKTNFSKWATTLTKVKTAVTTFQCSYCNVFKTIDVWENHVIDLHSNAETSISCACVLCETLIFGDKKSVIEHPHFKYNCIFFSLSHYPRMAALLEGTSSNYFKYESKLLRSNADQLNQLAFYCATCDAYCFVKAEKHLQSKSHKSRASLNCDLHYCGFCFALIYGDERLISHHNLSRSHILMKSRCKPKTLPGVENQKHRLLMISLKSLVEKNLKEDQNYDNIQCLWYYCDLCYCLAKTRDEWTFHKISEKHEIIVKKNHSQGNLVGDYICVFCKLSIFGTIFSHVTHSCSYGHESIKNYVIDCHNNTNISAIKPIESKPELGPVTKNTKEKAPKEKPNQEIYAKTLEVKNLYEMALNVKAFLDIMKNNLSETCKTFNCWYCNKFFSAEKNWWNHLQLQSHIDKVTVYYQSSKSYKAVAIFCCTCNLLMIGPPHVQTSHPKKVDHLKKSSKVKMKPKKSSSSQSSDTEKNLDARDIQQSTSTLNRSRSMSSNASSIACDNEDKSEDEGDDLYNVLVNGENDDEVSDHELDDSFLNEIKDDLPTENMSVPERIMDGKTEVESSDREIVKHLIIVKGIPAEILKNKKFCYATFTRYGVIKRIFTKNSKPEWLYLVVLTEPEEVFNRLQKSIVSLKKRLGTDELSFEYDTRNTDNTGIKKHLTVEVEEIFSNVDALNEAVNELMRHYEMESNSNESRLKVKRLESTILDLATLIYGPNLPLKVFTFGSRVTGLATENSDVDIYLQIDNSFGGGFHNNASLQQQLVLLFSNKMKQYHNEFKNVVSIPFARVPIVKFTHIESKLNCDLSFKSGLSTMNSMLVKTYLELDDRIKFIVCAVKLWMKKNDLADRNLFTTYAQIWMVLFFLMQPDIAVVPTVLKIRSTLPEMQQIVYVEGWNCAFPKISNIIWRSNCTYTKEQLLLKFFEFYSNEKLIDYVMCTLTGIKMSKKYFLESYPSLPSTFNEYKARVNSDRTLYWKVSDDFIGLCVQDPFDHCHNLTKTINVRKFNAFINLCQLTVEKMKLIM